MMKSTSCVSPPCGISGHVPLKNLVFERESGGCVFLTDRVKSRIERIPAPAVYSPRKVATASGSETTSVIGFAGDSRTVAFVEALWQRACDVPSRHGFCRITGELLEAICCC
jgi:hypothetical protein